MAKKVVNKLSYGADIEFVARRLSDNVPASVEGLIKGTKQKPKIIKKGNVQEDNILPEMAIDIAYTREEFIDNIMTVQNGLKRILNKYELLPSLSPSAYYPSKECQSEQAKLFGCEPDFNCWTGDENPAPKLGLGQETFRTAGGHVHFGFPEVKKWSTAQMEMVQWMDIFLGIPSLTMDVQGQSRRQLYGKAGAYRPKDYGVEYRSMSNWWATEKGAGWVFDQVNTAYKYFQMGPVREVFGDIGQEVQNVINRGDATLGRRFFTKYGLEYKVV